MRVVVRPFNTSGDPVDLGELLPEYEGDTLSDGALELQIEDTEDLFELLSEMGVTATIEAVDEDSAGFGEATLSLTPTAG